MCNQNKLEIMNEYFKAFCKQLKQDYKTARFKTEVVFDTLLLPEILLTLVKDELQIEAEYITKEFPIYNWRGKVNDEEKDYRSFAVDYLLKGKDTVYLVELKTDNDSYEPDQEKKYQLVKNNANFEDLFVDYWKMYYAKKYFEQAKQILINFCNYKVENEIDLYNRAGKRTDIIDELRQSKKLSSYKLEIIYIVPSKVKRNSDKSTIGEENNLKCIELDSLDQGKYRGSCSEFIKIWKYVRNIIDNLE